MGGEGNEVPPPLVKLEAGEDNAMDKLCLARFELYPVVAEPLVYWGKLKAKYDVILPEFGSEIRGMLHKVPKKTWASAHDRRRATELKHWCSLNYHNFKQEVVCI